MPDRPTPPTLDPQDAGSGPVRPQDGPRARPRPNDPPASPSGPPGPVQRPEDARPERQPYTQPNLDPVKWYAGANRCRDIIAAIKAKKEGR